MLMDGQQQIQKKLKQKGFSSLNLATDFKDYNIINRYEIIIAPSNTKGRVILAHIGFNILGKSSQEQWSVS